MSGSAPFAVACGLLVLLIVLAIGLIPVLDAELRRAVARRDAALGKLAGQQRAEQTFGRAA